MFRQIVFFIFLVSFLGSPLFSQDMNEDIEKSINGKATETSQEMNHTLGKACATKTAMLTDYIAFMADKEKKLSSREYYKTQALQLFVSSGYSYVKDGIVKDGVIIQIESKYRKKPIVKLIRDFFDSIIHNYSSPIQIEAIEVAEINVASLRKIGDNEYECTCTFDQAFCGYRDGRPLYRDITPKHVECRIILEDCCFEGLTTIELFGDIYAIETR